MWAATRPPRKWVARHSPVSWTTRAYRRLRSSHQVRVLRWLRNGMLLAVAATLLLYLGVVNDAHRRIDTARQTEQAIMDISNAYKASSAANTALSQAFEVGDPTLSNTGSTFASDTSQATAYIVAASGGNAAGPSGEQQLQFIQGQLGTCISLADTAVLEYGSLNREAAQAASSCLIDPDQQPVNGAEVTDTGGLTAALADLELREDGALAGQRASFWLHPGAFLWLLLLPSFAMLALLIATGYVLARYFRRLVSPLLAGALLVTASVAVAVGAFSASDDAHLSADPWAPHLATELCVLVLLAAALVLTYFGYRSRLAEYRFQAS